MLHCFEPGSVVCDLASEDKFDAIREVIARSTVFTEAGGPAAVEKAVITRERLQSTGIGVGVAVAHGEVTRASAVTIALGISRQGIDFDSADHQRVHLLFVFATPPAARQEYLLALCTIARLVKSDFFRRVLKSGLSAAQIQDQLRGAFQKILDQLESRHKTTAVTAPA